MPSTRLRRPVTAASIGLLALGIALGGLAACGDDDTSTDTETTAPEDVKAPISEVLAALPVMVEHGAQAASAAATGDYTAALAEHEELRAIWEDIEGTVEDTDPDVHGRIEAAQRLIEDGAENDDDERIQRGADQQEIAAAEFIAAHSAMAGTGTTATTAPAAVDGPITSTTTGGAGDTYATDEGMTS
jgi:hypothetical protein